MEVFKTILSSRSSVDFMHLRQTQSILRGKYSQQIGSKQQIENYKEHVVDNAFYVDFCLMFNSISVSAKDKDKHQVNI